MKKTRLLKRKRNFIKSGGNRKKTKKRIKYIKYDISKERNYYKILIDRRLINLCNMSNNKEKEIGNKYKNYREINQNNNNNNNKNINNNNFNNNNNNFGKFSDINNKINNRHHNNNINLFNKNSYNNNNNNYINNNIYNEIIELGESEKE